MWTPNQEQPAVEDLYPIHLYLQPLTYISLTSQPTDLANLAKNQHEVYSAPYQVFPIDCQLCSYTFMAHSNDIQCFYSTIKAFSKGREPVHIWLTPATALVMSVMSCRNLSSCDFRHVQARWHLEGSAIIKPCRTYTRTCDVANRLIFFLFPF